MELVFINSVPVMDDHLNKLRKLYKHVVLHKTLPNNTSDVIARAQNAEVIVSNWFPLDKSIISKLPKLKNICISSTHFEYIDVEYSSKKGIKVSNIKDYCVEAVAQHTIALILDASKHITRSNLDLIQKDIWQPKLYSGIELWGKTLGIIGYGKIGSLVGRTMEQAFKMKINKYNSKSKRKDLVNLLQNSDIVTVHLPLSEKTEGIIGEEELGYLKENTILVNTGKAGVINEAELIKFLKDNRIIYASDVFHEEPIKCNNVLAKLDNTILTPHCAWNTTEAMCKRSLQIYNNLVAIKKGKPLNLCYKKSNNITNSIVKNYSTFMNK